MKVNAYFSVYGSGLGHAARCVWLAKGLGLESIFSTWGEAKEFVINNGFKAITATPLDAVWSEEGRISFRKSTRGFPRTPNIISVQLREELKNIKMLRPDLVISDSRLTPLVASTIRKVPSILIINQPQVLMPLEDSAFQKLIQKSFAQSLSAFWDLAHSVIVPDLPPPYTISGASLEGLIALKRKIKYAGFFVHRPKERGRDIRLRFNLAHRLIYAPISGPAPTRAFLVDLLIKAMAFLPTGVSLVVSKGDTSGSISMDRHGQHMILGWDDLRRDFMAQADLIVCRGGQTTIGEAILNGKPMAIFPIPLHGEQVENAKKSAKMGFARVFNQYTPDPKGLATDLVRMMEDGEFALRAEGIRDVAISFDAQNIVAQEVYELISRQPA